MKIKYTLYLLLTYSCAWSQYDHQAVFPEMEGNALFNALVETYTIDKQLSYGMARDTMFANVDAVNDSLSTIYTGMTLYLPPDEDPTQAVFFNGMDNGINTEHSYPRSKGAENGNARADMHHLYPSRIKTNNARGSRKFAEINDAQTLTWFRDTEELSGIPSTDIDEYSELSDDSFEPRESVKGDIARSIMYFYTIYRQQAMSADPNYFTSMEETLCDWHYADPVDQKEWERTWKIAKYQEDKPNPFVLDCSLANRMYCGTISTECLIVDTDEAILEKPNIWPNPATDIIWLDGIDENWSVKIYDALGRIVSTDTSGHSISLLGIDSGIYFMTLTQENQSFSYTFIKL